MSLLDDILGSDTFKDFIAISDEVDNLKQELASSLTESATDIKTTLNDSTEQITGTATDVADTIRNATDLNQ